MVSEDITKKCNGVDLSYNKILIHKKANSRGSSDEDENNYMLLILAVQQWQHHAVR